MQLRTAEAADAVVIPVVSAGAVTVWNAKATFPYAPSSDLVVMVSRLLLTKTKRQAQAIGGPALTA